MRSQVLEARVLQIVDAVLRGGNLEDSRVELKASWPTDHARAARQIAGLANAAGGDDVLWIIGVDENAHAITEVEPTELQNWWGATFKRFSELAPEMQVLNVPVPSGETVVAMSFNTSRAPYLVTTDGRAGVEREIPWREGNATRSARRSEILRTVVEQARTPQLELLEASLYFSVDRNHPDGWTQMQTDPDGAVETVSLQGSAVLFVEAQGPAFFPEHRWTTCVRLHDGGDVFLKTRVSGPVQWSGTGPYGAQQSTAVGAIEYIPKSGVDIRGSNTITVSFYGNVPIGLRKHIELLDVAPITCTFPIATTARSVSITFDVLEATVRPQDSHLGFKVMTHDARTDEE